ncbi:hypothetical protein LT30_04162 [Escherichia coli]|nr:hypothetical protein LT30_04162 [Escherichia coli]
MQFVSLLPPVRCYPHSSQTFLRPSRNFLLPLPRKLHCRRSRQRSFLMILPPLLKPTHPGLRWQLLTLSWSRWMQMWPQIFVMLRHSFPTFSLHRHWWLPRFLKTLRRQHFLMLQWPLLMPFLRWKTLTEPTTRPVRLTCWLHVLSLQHQSHGLPPHGLMCWHRWLTSSRLPCSVPPRTRYAPPLPPSVQNGAVPQDGHHPPSWHRENHSAYRVGNLHTR